ncbi:MAG: hypothetical protein ABIW76_15020 [Fibrobacteria bacterium]
MKDPTDGSSVLMQAGYLPDTSEYTTTIRHFPGTNAHLPWGTHGRFSFEVEVFENGVKIGSDRTPECDESGSLEMDIGALAERCGRPVNGMYVVKYRHAKEIPVEVYAFHVHKASGTYVSCNIIPFIGDQLYPTVHTDQMENTLFWPGLIPETDSESHLVVVNPYDENMGFQVHAMGAAGVLARTAVLHIKPFRAATFPLPELFFECEAEIRAAKGKVSFCVSSQYKLIAYMMFKSRGQVMSMMDHLHNFCLA